MSNRHAPINLEAEFRLTPIGSCRIVGPLSVAARRFGFELNMSRTYGYSHSSLEAVQHARYLQGDYHASKEIWPMISRRSEFEAHKLTSHAPSDIYVVEICSSKQLTYRGHALQLNYLQHHFADFFSCPERSRAFWVELTKGSPKCLIESVWPGAKRKTERDFLSELQLRQTTDTAITSHLKELKERLKNLVVVTHVDAKRSDGSVIPARSAQIMKVKRAAEMLDIPCFDPTRIMKRIGQSKALVKGESLTHYSDNFSGRLSEDLYFGPISDALPKNKGYIRKRTQELHNKAIEASECTECEPIEYLGRTLGQHQAGKPNFARSSLNGIYLAARANEYLGKFRQSAELYRSLTKAEKNREAAVAFLQTRQLSGKPAKKSETFLNVLLHSADINTVLEYTFDRNELLGLLRSANSAQAWNRVFEKLLDSTASANWVELLRTALADHDSNQFDLVLDPKLVGKICLSVEECSTPLHALKDLQQIQILAGKKRAFSRQIKAMQKRAAVQAKSNFSEQNIEALAEDFYVNSQLSEPIENINLLFARAKFQIGEYQKAAEISLLSARRTPEDLTPWIVAMRSAQAAGNLINAQLAAEKIVKLAAKNNPRYLNEATSLLQELGKAA